LGGGGEDAGDGGQGGVPGDGGGGAAAVGLLVGGGGRFGEQRQDDQQRVVGGQGGEQGPVALGADGEQQGSAAGLGGPAARVAGRRRLVAGVVESGDQAAAVGGDGVVDADGQRFAAGGRVGVVAQVCHGPVTHLPQPVAAASLKLAKTALD